MTRPQLGRRDAIRLAGGCAAGVALGGAATPAVAQEDLSGWFSDVSNFEGVVDRTGQDSVTVAVGSEANGGAFGFSPPAVRVDPGTAVEWEWTGEGSMHNVVGRDADFESELTDEAGHTFSQTFEDAGVYRYVCGPHEAMGMKGAVVVGDVEVSASGDGSGGGETTASKTATPAPDVETEAAADGGGAGYGPAYLVGGGLLGALVSPLLFGLFVLLTDDRER